MSGGVGGDLRKQNTNRAAVNASSTSFVVLLHNIRIMHDTAHGSERERVREKREREPVVMQQELHSKRDQ